MLCRVCYGENIPPKRAALGFLTCLICGEKQARQVKHAIVPLPKSNYIYAHNKEDVLSPYSHKGNR